MTGEPDPAGGAAIDRRAIDAVTLVYAGVALLFGALIVSAPLTVLLDRFIPDDAFYYFNTARIFAASGTSSFDQIHFTNGYHPLWFLLSVPVFLVFPEGGELPFRLMLLLQVLLACAATGLMARKVATLFGPAVAAVTGLPWIVVVHRATVNGLETALYTCLFALVFCQFLDYVAERRGALALGVTSGLLFLARTDAVFLLVALAAWFAWQARRDGRIRDLVAFVAPASAIAGAYLAINLATTGHLMPVSGAAKVYHSDVARAATMAASGGTLLSTVAGNLWWPVSQRAWWAVLALLSPAVLLAGAWRTVVNPSVRLARETWPFALALWAAFVFYGVAFFGGFSSTLWYYPPLVLAGWFYLAAASVSRLRRPSDPLHPWTWSVPWAVIALSFGWLGTFAAALAPVGAAATALVALFLKLDGRARVVGVATVGVTIAVVAWRMYPHVSLSTWAATTTTAVVLGGLLAMPRLSRYGLAQVVVGIVVPTFLVHGVNLAVDVKSKPANWNYHLYLGAEWARRTLPPSATIWSGSAGILGYFSGHRVVNTDGLANDFDFLEHTLETGKTGAYVRQWDYAIDAYGSDRLQDQFPEGCLVPLPPEAIAPEFEDGALRRRLRVFQMKPVGIVTCRDLRPK